jgi:hypothetical protein
MSERTGGGRSTGNTLGVPYSSATAPSDPIRIDAVWLANRLEPAAREHGVSLTSGCTEKLAHYAELLLSWNRRINLTGARSADVLVDAHLADALSSLSRAAIST